MLAGVGANALRAQLRQWQTAQRNVLMAGVWGGATLAMRVSVVSPMFWLRVDKQPSEQANSRSKGQKRSGLCWASGGVAGWQAGQEEWQRDWKFWQVVFSAGCGSLCQAPDARKHENRGVRTLCQEDRVLPGVLDTRFISSWNRGKYVMPPKPEDSSKVRLLEEAEAPRPAKLVIVNPSLASGTGTA